MIVGAVAIEIKFDACEPMSLMASELERAIIAQAEHDAARGTRRRGRRKGPPSSVAATRIPDSQYDLMIQDAIRRGTDVAKLLRQMINRAYPVNNKS